MRSLAESLQATLTLLGIRGGVARAAAVAAWRDVAREAIGADAGRTRALRVEAGTIVVAVPSPVLAQELRLRTGELVAALAERAPEAGVRDVRFVPK